jgi:hypothetical protein
MKSTPSPRVRFLAVLALILCAGVGAYLLLHGSGSSGSTGTGTTGTEAITNTTTHAQTTTTSSKKTHKRRHKTPVEGVAALDAALVAHPLVVVSVYARNVTTDTAAMKEAKAGAAEVGAGFVAFDVYREKLARQLATLLADSSQVTNPEVLFFKRPRTLAFTLRGFSDSQVVAQAAQNVFPHVEPWVGQANRVCRQYAASLATAMAKSKSASTDTAAGRNQSAASIEEVAGLLSKVTKSLIAVRANASTAKDYAQFVSDLQQLATDLRSEAVALRRGDLASAKTIAQKEVLLSSTTDSLAANLQITACAP